MAQLTDSRITDALLKLNAKIQQQEGIPLPNPTLYHPLVGSPLYITMRQPDISHAIQVFGFLGFFPTISQTPLRIKV